MAERVAIAASAPAPDRADRGTGAARARPVSAPERMLDLQRSAGNALARQLAGTPAAAPAPRLLARCGGGQCTCGGTCGGHKEELLEEELGASLLRRAVAARHG